MADYISRFKGSEIDEGVEKGRSVGEIVNLLTDDKNKRCCSS